MESRFDVVAYGTYLKLAMKNAVLMLVFVLPIHCMGQDLKKKVEEVNNQLASGSKTISAILTDPALMQLHSLTEFREVIKKYAKQEKISLANKSEPGTAVTIKGRLRGSESVSNLLIYVYHTDNRGWYSDTGAHVLMREGDRGHARLFGYLKSDANGQFEFTTIHPQGYPQSDLPQHIHLEVYNNSGRNLIVTELLFDDDARLKGEIRKSALENGFQVAKNEGGNGIQLYSYTVTLR